MSKGMPKQPKKQVRKPVSDSFAPKRLAINFQPPTIIMQYLVVDTGKLYHHKMRLDSILKKLNVSRVDVLNYVKNKHYLYFVNGKIKDQQLLKFIDKILLKINKNKPSLTQINEQTTNPALSKRQQKEDDDFDYLNDDDEYEEDYEDYEPEDKPQAKVEQKVQAKKQSSNQMMFNKNTFMTYCQEYEESNDEEAGAQWDLDMDEDADYV